MNMIVLVLMMAVTVEALVRIRQDLRQSNSLKSNGKPPPRRRDAVALGVAAVLRRRRGLLRRAGRELQRGVAVALRLRAFLPAAARIM